jgi:hypothetical protein
MKFYRPPKVRHNIQVIPMIDILLILLIYFAVSTVFKKPRDILHIDLPTVREIPSDTVAETRSSSALTPSATSSSTASPSPKDFSKVISPRIKNRIPAGSSNSRPIKNSRSNVF